MTQLFETRPCRDLTVLGRQCNRSLCPPNEAGDGVGELDEDAPITTTTGAGMRDGGVSDHLLLVHHGKDGNHHYSYEVAEKFCSRTCRMCGARTSTWYISL